MSKKIVAQIWHQPTAPINERDKIGILGVDYNKGKSIHYIYAARDQLYRKTGKNLIRKYPREMLNYFITHIAPK